MQLFPQNQIVGVFRGFQESGLEFHADLVLPYKNEFQSMPMHGQFILVRLESEDEAVLGRITSLSPDGKLSSSSGEDFNVRAMREGRDIPEDIREQYLKYKINIRVLGVLRNSGNKLTFVPSHRRLPHVGSPVAFPSDDVLKEISGHNLVGAQIGFYAMGEYIFAGDNKILRREDWMQVKAPEILINFPIENLVSRRSFIFARAGFGKSNLNKLLFSNLYRETPHVEKRAGREVPVGTVLFDPDGEYFWPDDRGRPGLCDVPHLKDRLVVFTPRKAPSEFYESFVASGIKLDIRRLPPSDVIAIALSPDRQEQQNVRKLRALNQQDWEELVNHIMKAGAGADIDTIAKLLKLDKDNQTAEAFAARSNMYSIVSQFHDPSSQFMDMLIKSLAAGKLCVVDVSQMRGNRAMILSGLVLRRIFDRNQQEFTKAKPETIPTIAVIEEAQSVLDERSSASEPYIAWIKEGRKYDLGAVLITQQPGSIPNEILSQGDNWFIFHLLSAGDLSNLKKANAHFSEDILGALLNEPIPGQGIFWSSFTKPYPVPIRILSFEQQYDRIDKDYNKAAVGTFATILLASAQHNIRAAQGILAEGSSNEPPVNRANVQLEFIVSDAPDNATPRIDIKELAEDAAIERLRQDREFQKIGSDTGIAWGTLQAILERNLPPDADNRREWAYNLVPKSLNRIFGEQNVAWHSYKHAERGTTYIKSGKRPN